MQKTIITATLAVTLGLQGLGAEAPAPLPVARLATPPVIDGRLEDGEWTDATGKFGFGVHATGLKELGLRQGRTLIGYDATALYLAIVTETPPDGSPLLSSVRNRDGRVIGDDGIEIWTGVTPGSARGTHYQYMVNPFGTIFDVRHYTGGGIPEESFDTDWRFASTVDTSNRQWICEWAIPLTTFDVGGAPDGKIIPFFAARNWKRPWAQAPFTGAAFSPPDQYARFLLSPAAPAVQVHELGALDKQFLDLTGTVRNASSKPRTLTAAIRFTHSDMPDWDEQRTFTVAPGATASFAFHADAGRIHQHASHTATLTVTEGGETVYRERYAWKLPREMETRWQTRAEGQSSLRICHYPSMRQLGVQMDFQERPDRVVIELSRDGRRLRRQTFEPDGDSLTAMLKTGRLRDGFYDVTARLFHGGRPGQVLSNRFERIVFPWEGNTLGRLRKVYAPFRELDFTGRDQINLTMNQVAFNGVGLYRSLNLAGRELLAEEAAFHYRDAAGEACLVPAGRARFTRRGRDAAVFEGRGEGRDFTVTTRGTTEYDGCTRFEMTLAPRRGRQPALDRFYLDLPLDARQIRLFHVIKSDTIRSNPAICAPEGTGVVWRSTDVSNGDFFGNLHVYLWLGEMERGVAWFADNDRNFHVDDEAPVQELIREGDRLTLRVWFVNKPLTLDAPRTIVFGMQPSPTRPMPADWRRPGKPVPMHGGSGQYWGINVAYAGKYPVNYDWRYVEEMVQARRTGKANEAFLKAFFDTYYRDLPQSMQQSYAAHHRGGHFNHMANAGHDPRLLYFEEHAQDQTTPEWRVFQDEWDTRSFTPRQWLTSISQHSDLGGAGVKIVPTRSYQDFALYYARIWMSYGIGTYFDNVFPRNTYDPHTSAAYVRADGNVQPSAAIWEMREYHKRMWVLTREIDEDSEYPLMKSVHMTNGMLLPVIAWTDINLDIEWSWADGRKPFPPELIEIETTGRQVGAYPHVLYALLGAKRVFEGPGNQGKVDPDMARTEWAIRVVYDVLRNTYKLKDIETLEDRLQAAGYADSRATVHKYWEAGYPVATDSADVKSTLVVNGRRGFLVLASWSGEPLTVQCRLDPSSTGKIVRAVALAPEQPVACRDNTLALSFAPYGMQAVELEFE